MKVYARTDRGRVRPNNEDSFLLPQTGQPFCAVADGMGGHNAGEIASALAVQTFAEAIEAEALSPAALRRAVKRANEKVFRESITSDGCYGMGTTFTALACAGDCVYIAHVGDSRAYRIRGDEIQKISTDHSLVEEMVRSGLLTPAEARVHPKRNIITRALGTHFDLDVDVLTETLEPGDIYFLCTDGLSNPVEDAQILAVTQMPDLSWDEKLALLITLAMDNGGTDNITALYAIFEEADE